ncbi:hypothetical protein [Caballeronia sp. RCC_10]
MSGLDVARLLRKALDTANAVIVGDAARSLDSRISKRQKKLGSPHIA